jgi:hypothetical protein
MRIENGELKNKNGEWRNGEWRMKIIFNYQFSIKIISTIKQNFRKYYSFVLNLTSY